MKTSAKRFTIKLIGSFVAVFLPFDFIKNVVVQLLFICMTTSSMIRKIFVHDLLLFIIYACPTKLRINLLNLQLELHNELNDETVNVPCSEILLITERWRNICLFDKDENGKQKSQSSFNNLIVQSSYELKPIMKYANLCHNAAIENILEFTGNKVFRVGVPLMTFPIWYVLPRQEYQFNKSCVDLIDKVGTLIQQHPSLSMSDIIKNLTKTQIIDLTLPILSTLVNLTYNDVERDVLLIVGKKLQAMNVNAN